MSKANFTTIGFSPRGIIWNVYHDKFSTPEQLRGAITTQRERLVGVWDKQRASWEAGASKNSAEQLQRLAQERDALQERVCQLLKQVESLQWGDCAIMGKCMGKCLCGPASEGHTDRADRLDVLLISSEIKVDLLEKKLAASTHLADTLEYVRRGLERAAHEGLNAYDSDRDTRAGWVTNLIDEINSALEYAGRGGE